MAEAGGKSAPLAPAILVLGFIVMVLLGVLISQNLRSRVPAAGDDAALAPIRAELEARRADLNRQRAEQGLSPYGGISSGETADQIATRLKKDADLLAVTASQLQSMLAESNTLLSQKNADLLTSEQARQSLMSQIAKLQADLNRALVDGSAVDLLKRQLSDVTAKRDAILNELEAARIKLADSANRPSSEAMADLQRRLDEASRAKGFFETRVKELESKITELESKLRSQSLFAKNENELLPAAVELFRSLRKLENQPDSEISAAYSGFGVNLSANVVKKLTFPTGSNIPSPDDEAAVRSLTATLPNEGLILVVGYASETGNVDDNRTLSSDRATAVAKSLDSAKLSGQSVQAVYLGQTDRFGSKFPERNQLCEIWQIRPQK
jgi:outer membrane protein OmpA-like peptidoglycan-associated protein